MKNDLIKIGAAARLFHISESTLRHYEKAGLLDPEYIDPQTGYRYYSARQFEALNTIRYLRALDMPLDEISDFLRNRDIDIIEEKLLRQKDAVRKKREELARIECKIDNRLNMLNSARNSELETVKIINTPALRVVWVSDSLKINGFLDMEAPIRRLEQSDAEAVIFLGKVGVGISADNLSAGKFDRYDGIFLVLDDEDIFNGETSVIPEGTCVSVRFCGSHPEAPVRYQRVMSFIRENGLAPIGFSREITLIDYGITNDTSKFVTEITVPVRSAQK